MHAVSIVREPLDFPELSVCGIRILLLSHYQLKPTKSIIVASHFEFQNCFEKRIRIILKIALNRARF